MYGSIGEGGIFNLYFISVSKHTQGYIQFEKWWCVCVRKKFPPTLNQLFVLLKKVRKVSKYFWGYILEAKSKSKTYVFYKKK